MGLHTNLCQALRQKIKDEGKNQTSFDNVSQQTISGLVNRRGNISTLCKALEELGVSDVKFDDNIVIFK